MRLRHIEVFHAIMQAGTSVMPPAREYADGPPRGRRCMPGWPAMHIGSRRPWGGPASAATPEVPA